MKETASTIVFLLMGVVYVILSVFLHGIPKPLLSLVLVFTTTVYLFGFYKINFSLITVNKILAVSIIYACILFVSPINYSSDTTAYALGARVAFLGKYNPFTTPYIQYETDEIYFRFKDYMWAKYPYTYSPLFLYTSGLLLFFSGNNIWVNILLFKILFLSTFVAGVFLFRKISGNNRILYLYSLNPIILHELVKEAHIESLIILIILAGLFYYIRGKYYLSFFAFLSLIFIKIYYVVFLPVFIYKFIRANKHWMKRLAIMLLAGFFIFVVLYLPFWRGFDTFKMVSGLFPGSMATIISFNFLAVPLMFVFQLFYSDPYKNYFASSAALFVVGCISILLYFAKNLKSRGDYVSLVNSLNIMYLLFILFLINWFFPHYATLSIMFFSLMSVWNMKKYSKALFFLTFYSSFYNLILK